jgi:bifunctional N-acetylglucosamine-1-phosphate-uridyltransferase/glucosamine-1-phosphate-acetyltransferase GlmU-like protein
LAYDLGFRELFVTTPLNVAILAAGQGKRMHSALPKVLHPLAGRPMCAHVVDTVRSLAPRAIVVVVGSGADAVQAALTAPDLAFVRQDPPLGTGDAARIALAAMPGDGITLIGLADVPLAPAAALAAARHPPAWDPAALTAPVYSHPPPATPPRPAAAIGAGESP